MGATTFCTEYSVFGFTDGPIDDRIAGAERALADLKAEKAKADAEKAKTVGERVAEGLICESPHKDDYPVMVTDAAGKSALFCPWTGESMPIARKILADAIDKAVADAKAEQREADAKIVEALSDEDASDMFDEGWERAIMHAAEDIRDQK